MYCGDTDPADPRLALNVAAGRALPPTLIQAGGAEMLAADAHRLAAEIRAAGGNCELQVWPDQVHVFQALPRLAPEAAQAMSHVASFIAETLSDQRLCRRKDRIAMFGMSPKRTHRADAVVTGAGSGIGAAFAVELAAPRRTVVCSDIDEAAAQRTVDAITDQGGKAVAVRCDVSTIDEVRELADASRSPGSATRRPW